MKLLPLVLLASLTLLAPAQEAKLPPAVAKARTAEELAAQTVVIFNENDLDSVALAGTYAEARGIPVKNLVGVKCTVTEEISRFDYDRSIAEPLRKIFEERGWWKLQPEVTDAGRVVQTKIRFVALMRGIPLKIAAEPNYKGDDTTGSPKVVFTHNEAAVDSELALLGLWATQISGVKENPYFGETKTIGETDLSSQLIVCRLDAPTAATARSMIADSIAIEKEGLRGFVYIDALGLKEGNLMIGDAWLQEAARDARESGLPVIMDNGAALFPKPYPLKHCAIYLGWYSEDFAGAFTADGFRFPKGAIAYHIHSFNAATLRDRSKNWCGPLLEAGAAATVGNVYEPYLGLLPRPNILSQRLREGFTFGEAAYMSQQYLSWMTTFIGDPLYRPFANVRMGQTKASNEWDAYRDGVGTWLTKGRKEGESALRAAGAKLKSGIVYESFGLLEQSGGDQAAAITAFGQARASYPEAADRIRVAVHEAAAIRASKGAAAAIKFLRDQAQENAGPHVEVLPLLAATMAEPSPKADKPAADKAAPPAKKKPR